MRVISLIRTPLNEDTSLIVNEDTLIRVAYAARYVKLVAFDP